MNKSTSRAADTPRPRALAPARLALPVLLAILSAPAAVADLPPHDENGGFSLVVTFDWAGLIQSGYLDVDGFTAERYCDIFEKTSHHLWQASERQHWIRRVDFRLGTTESDINWFFTPQGETSFGGFKNSIALRENFGNSRSPANNGGDAAKLEEFDEGISWLLVHEIGHFLYGASDEYIHARTKNGTLGLCSGYSIGICGVTGADCLKDSECDDVNPGDTCLGADKQTCDDDDDCIGFGNTCIFMERRKGNVGEPSKICSDHDDDDAPGSFTECDDDLDCQGLEDAETGGDAVCTDSSVLFFCSGLLDNETYCWTDEDCQQGGDRGFCVREGEGGQPGSTRVCRDPDAPFPAEADADDYRNRTSIMAAAGAGGRWCDDLTHRHSRWIQRWTRGGFDEEGQLVIDPQFELTLDPSYSTWDRVVRSDLSADDDGVKHPDLRSYFDNRNGYPAWSALEKIDFVIDTDFNNEFDCDWNIDEIPIPGDNTVLIVDKSGSMDYEIGTSSATKLAFEWAAEGALAVMEDTDPANYTGIIAFDSDTTTIQSYVERSTISIPDDPFDELFDGVEPGGNTNLAAGILAATQEMTDTGPASNRNIILMSDGENTVENDPTALEAAQAACQEGIVVNTIAFGDANLAELKELADACSGFSLVSATENQLLEGEDAHILKSEFVRMRYLVQGLDTIFEDVLGTLSDDEDVISRSFYVPVDAGPLTFVWIGNEVPYCVEFLSGEICIDEREVWSELTFELEGPSQQVAVGARGNSFQALAHVSDPEPGWWTARVDASAVPVDQNQIIREAARVSWLAVLDHPDLMARAWVDQWKRDLDEPVLINASLYFKAPLTEIGAVAYVTKQGVEYAPFPLFDDGQHGDGESGDAVYGGYFNPNGDFFTTPGAYGVEVSLFSVEGISSAVTFETFEAGADDAEPIEAASVVAEADTQFHLWSYYGCGSVPSSAPCPEPGTFDLPLGVLPQGSSIPGLSAVVTELPLLDGRVGIDLGPGVHVSNLSIQSGGGGGTGGPGGPGGPGGTGSGLGGVLSFDVVADPVARVGLHTASVWVGTRKLTAEYQVVCGEVDLAPPIIEAPNATAESCSVDPTAVPIPAPLAFDECSSGPVTVLGWVETINGEPAVPPAPIDPSNPVAVLPLGDAIVLWQATDMFGNSAQRRQRIDVELGATCDSSAGRVGDGSQAGEAPLLIEKLAGGEIRLSWSPSCSALDVDYGIYEGSLGSFDSHEPQQCTTGGATEQTLTPSSGDRYYLVVPRNGLREGSYGFDGSGAQRQPSAAACLPQELSACADGPF